MGTPVSATNKTGLHDITEILLKEALKTRTLTLITDKSNSLLHFSFEEKSLEI
jgi:hypothetical protein